MAEVNQRKARVETRALNPQQKVMIHFKTFNYDTDIAEHKKYIREVMIENPFATYMSFRTRLENQGADADFPEFKGVVGFLTKALFQSEITKMFERPEYSVLLDQVLNKLMAIQIEGSFNYPYRSTIYCIESMLELIDFYYRTISSKSNGNKPNEKIGPYYHIFRYRSSMTTFTDSDYGIPKNIIFPTFVAIGSMDLIKMRCVPILLMGIVSEPIYVDQYLNSPLDFWAHDIQHSKRQIQETERYYDEFIKHNRYYTRRTLFHVKSEVDFYKYMEDFTKNKLMPIIKFKEEDSPEVKAIKAIMKIIVFEVVHEKAWPLTEKSLCKIITMRYDEFPIENIDLIDGKIQTFHYLFADPTTIGSIVGKLRHGFYDKIKEVNNKIVPKEFRTSENVAKAAKQLLEAIGCSEIPSEQYLIALATDRHAMQEYEDMPSINIANVPPTKVNYPLNEKGLFNNSELYPTFKPVASANNIAKQNSLHKLKVVEANSNWMEGTRKKRGGSKRKTRHR